ncbi:MAG: threonylcarbamoyl-AMP synthase [Lachnospiraceae bacterium]|nr:threonylcarbamoyl-AMP synthase [Lachnospiraceae bacterium]
METGIIRVDRDHLIPEDIRKAAEIIRNGGLVAFPTETVYGLGGDAFDPTASKRIYAAKGRPSDNPLIVHIADISELTCVARDIPQVAYDLAQKFWPGPLTMILNKRKELPCETTGGLNTVAVRMPSDPVAAMLIREAGVPIAAPSANLSGRPSTTCAQHVIEDLSGRIDMIIDAGASQIGLESTIVDLTCEPALILRPGFITKEMLETLIPDIGFDKAVSGKPGDEKAPPKAPGMKYRHYAPKGDLVIYSGNESDVINRIKEETEKELAKGSRVGILVCDEEAGAFKKLFGDSVTIKTLGSRDNEEEIASVLFAKLREFDGEGTEKIFSQALSDGGLGSAIMNRLMKAAGYRIYKL